MNKKPLHVAGVIALAVLLAAALLLAGCGGGLKPKEQGQAGIDWPMYGGAPPAPPCAC